MPLQMDAGRSSALIWVTGINGFLGRHVASTFASEGWSVAGTCRKSLPDPPGANVVMEDKDLERALTSLLQVTGPPDVVFHAVGSGTVGETIHDPDTAREATVESFRTAMRFAEAEAADAVVLYPSSCSVYGQVDRLPVDEEMPLRPISPYGRLKLEVEELCARSSAFSGIRTGVIRYFSLYGAGLRKQLVWDLASRIARGEREIELAGTGNERRDFLHATDGARLAYMVGRATLERPKGAAPLIVNGGSGTSLTVREVATVAAHAVDPQAKITFSGIPRPGDPTMFEASTCRARSLGFSVTIPPEDGLAVYSRWTAEELRPGVGGMP